MWDVIAEHARLYHVLTGHDAKCAVDMITMARRQYKGKHNPVTSLTILVDRYLDLEKEVDDMEPPRTLTLTIRPGPPAATASNGTESENIVKGLVKTMKSLNIDWPWPPTYFSPRELVFLADNSVISALAGADHFNPQPRQELEDVNSFSMPSTLRIGLCHLALVHYLPEKDWALWMTPVGYLTPDLRQDWYIAAGREARAFSTIQDFLTHATDAFCNRGKTFVVGMFTYWCKQSHGIWPTVDVTREDPDVWRRGHMMQRYSMVLILRIARFGDGDKLQIISYDPLEGSKTIRDQYAHSLTLIYTHREARMDAIKTWAGNNGLQIHSRYLGGLCLVMLVLTL